MSVYHNVCEKSIIPSKLNTFFKARPFLLNEKILDIELPLSKMRKLKHLNEYDNDSIEFTLLESEIKNSKFQKEEMYLGKVDKSEKTAICLHFTAGDFKGADSTTYNSRPNRSRDDHNAVYYGKMSSYNESE
ncbi:hypothetical protein [Spirochaeta cellobiosiphila]|uniref:hypothetical protein n=1 Tax=Spirochaeta cellobiosiphila TaxID=504483 RepID=UPI0004160223|nr:hypothetical protein [Spirochaeta cellobiosiphila]